MGNQLNQKNHILKSLLSWGLGYMRWTQLTPMVLLWGFSLLMLLALMFVNFQVQTISALEYVLKWLLELPVVGDHISEMLSEETTEVNTDTVDFKTLILSAWAILSLVLMLTGVVLSSLFGPFTPWKLKRKVLVTGVACVVLLGGMIFNYYIAPQNFNGEASAWILNFSLISLLVFVVSVYCLSIAHFLGFLNDVLLTGEWQNADS